MSFFPGGVSPRGPTDGHNHRGCFTVVFPPGAGRHFRTLPALASVVWHRDRLLEAELAKLGRQREVANAVEHKVPSGHECKARDS